MFVELIKNSKLNKVQLLFAFVFVISTSFDLLAQKGGGGTFEIVEPTRVLSSPSTGTKFQPGDDITIEYNEQATLVGPIELEVNVFNSEHLLVAGPQPYLSEPIIWTVPGSFSPGEYTLQLTVKDNGDLKAYIHEASFTVCEVCENPVLFFNSDFVHDWKKVDISWSHPDDGINFQLFLDDEDGNEIALINSTSSKSPVNYTVEFDMFPMHNSEFDMSKNYVLRVQAADYPDIKTISNPFYVLRQDANVSVGTNACAQNETSNMISWNKTGTQGYTYNIELRDAVTDAPTGNYVDLNYYTTGNSYNWPTSNVPVGDYKMLVRSTNGLYAYYSNTFKVRDVCEDPNIIAPNSSNGSDELINWLTHDIEWTWDEYTGNAATFQVYVEKPGGSSLDLGEVTTKDPDGTYRFEMDLTNSPLSSGDGYRIRLEVELDENDQRIIYSDDFSIIPAEPMIFPNESSHFMERDIAYDIIWGDNSGTTYDILFQNENSSNITTLVTNVGGGTYNFTPDGSINFGNYRIIVKNDTRVFRSQSAFEICSDCATRIEFEVSDNLIRNIPETFSWAYPLEADNNQEGMYYDVYLSKTGETGRGIKIGSKLTTRSFTFTPDESHATFDSQGNPIYYKFKVYPNPELDQANFFISESTFKILTPQEFDEIVETNVTYSTKEVLLWGDVGDFEVTLAELDGTIIPSPQGLLGTVQDQNSFDWLVLNSPRDYLLRAYWDNTSTLYQMPITVHQPIQFTANSVYEKGFKYNISWNYEGASNTWGVYLEKMDGFEIVGDPILLDLEVEQELDGSYGIEWVPGSNTPTGSDYRMRIDPGNGEIQYISDKNFSIVENTASEGVVFPNGDEKIVKSETPEVTWKFSITDPVSFQVDLVKITTSGEEDVQDIGNTGLKNASSDGTYRITWDVDNTLETGYWYKIRVTPSAGNVLWSTKKFFINDHPLVFPNTEKWVKLTEDDIEWDQHHSNYSYPQDIDVEIILDKQGYAVPTTIWSGQLNATNGKFKKSWTPESNVTNGNYKFYVKTFNPSNSEPLVPLQSTGWFSIGHHSMSFPGRHDELVKEFTYEFKWSYPYMVNNTSFQVQLKRNSGQAGTIILGSTGPLEISSNGYYTFDATIPSHIDVSDDYYVLIYPSDSNLPRVSSSTFLIKDPFVKSPTGILGKGTTVPIVWDYHTTERTFEVYLDRAGQESETPIFTTDPISTNEQGRNTVNWTLDESLINGDQYKLRLIPVEDGLPIISENSFEITEIPIDFPKDGSMLYSGHTYNISWVYASEASNSNFDIFFERDGQPYETIATNVAKNGNGTQLFEWTLDINQEVGNDFRIRVVPSDDGIEMPPMMSTGFFKIDEKPINYPSYSEVLTRGDTYEIKWSGDKNDLPNGTSFNIYLISTDDGQSQLLMNTGSMNSYYTSSFGTGHSFKVNWTIDEDIPLGDNYKIRVLPDNGHFAMRSKENFRIIQNSVIYPNGGEYLNKNSDYTFSWTYHNPETSFKIYLYEGGGYSSLVTTEEISPSYGNVFEYTLNLDNGQVGRKYKVLIRPQDGGEDIFSDGFVNVICDVCDQPDQIISPNGTVSLVKGNTYEIRWEGRLPSNSFDLELRSTDPAFDHYDMDIVTLGNVSVNADNEYAYYWTVPNSLNTSTLYEIVITPTEGNHSFVSNELTFIENSDDQLYLTYPNGEEFFHEGESYEITWDYLVGYGTTFDVYLKERNNGGNMLLGTTTPVSSLYQVAHSFTVDFSGIDYDYRYYFEVVPSNGGNVLESRDRFVLCNDCDGFLPLQFPNGGENIQLQKTYEAQWTSSPGQGQYKLWLESAVSDDASRGNLGSSDYTDTYRSIYLGMGEPGDYYESYIIIEKDDDGVFYKSSSPFNICENCTNPFSLSTPNGGEIFSPGEIVNVGWTGVNEERRTEITLLDYSGVEIASETAYRVYNYDFTIPTGIEGYFKFKIENNGGERISEDWIYIGESQSLNSIENISYSYDASGQKVNGKNKSFFSANGKLLQSQYVDVASGEVMASQPLYDHYDNAAGNTLVAPINFKNFLYKENFVTNSGQSYDYTQFDYSSSPGYQPNGVDRDDPGSLGYYYGLNYDGVAASIVPISLTEFYYDGTGETKRSSRFGNHHNLLDTYSEDHKAYSKTFQVLNDLDGVYLEIRNLLLEDNEITLKKKATKVVSRDEDKKEVITYYDSHGNVIANGFSQGITASLRIDYNDEVVDEFGDLLHFDFHIPSDVSIKISSRIEPIPGKSVQIIDLEDDEALSSSSYIRDPGFYRCFDCKSFDFSIDYYDMAYNFYDDAGRLIATISPNGVSQLQSISLNSSSVWDLPFATYYTYDHKGQLIERKEPDTGLTKYIYNEKGLARFSENAQQRLDGNFSFTDYDEDDRPIQSGEYTGAWDDVSPDQFDDLDDLIEESGITFGEQEVRDWVSTEYDFMDESHEVPLPADQKYLLGQVSYTENESSKTWYSYDELGRVSWTAVWYKEVFDHAKVIEYTYDFNGNVVSTLYQQGEQDQFYHFYKYDDGGRLLEVYASGYASSESELVSDDLQAKYSYYLHGPLKSVELATDLQKIDYFYDINGWISSINDISDLKNDVFAQAYTYFTDSNNKLYNGNIGHIAWVIDDPDQSNPRDDEMGFVYDEKNQLIDYNYSTVGERITYDANGNIKYFFRKSWKRLTSTTTEQYQRQYQYLLNSNKVSDIDGLLYLYNAIGQPISIGGPDGANLKYNVSGNLVEYENLDNNTKSYSIYGDNGFRINKKYETDNGISEQVYVRDASGNIITIYNKDFGQSEYTVTETPVYGASRLGTYYHLSGDIQYEIKDHLGNVRSIISKQTRDVEYWANYFPFGKPSQEWGSPSRYGYQGDFSENDEETGLNHFEARDYDPSYGRFLTPDPAGQFHSPYVGMGNNPINGVDPDGRWFDDIIYRQNGEEVLRIKTDHPYDIVIDDYQFMESGLNYTDIRLYDKIWYSPDQLTASEYREQADFYYNLAFPRASGAVYSNFDDLGGILATELATLGIGKGAYYLSKVLRLSKATVTATTTTTSLVQQNRTAGNAFRDALAAALKAEGRDVEIEVFKRTPFGARFMDIEVSMGGRVLGGIETKVGKSRYHALQRLKDIWLELNQGYPVQLVRKPPNW